MKKLLVYFISLTLMLSGMVAYAESDTAALTKIDMTKWQYEAADDVYWQVGLSYAATPADSSYETMGIFVPGAYFTGTDNGDGTWTCTVNESGSIGKHLNSNISIISINDAVYSDIDRSIDFNYIK